MPQDTKRGSQAGRLTHTSTPTKHRGNLLSNRVLFLNRQERPRVVDQKEPRWPIMRRLNGCRISAATKQTTMNWQHRGEQVSVSMQRIKLTIRLAHDSHILVVSAGLRAHPDAESHARGALASAGACPPGFDNSSIAEAR
jgi:hypothetical protein